MEKLAQVVEFLYSQLRTMRASGMNFNTPDINSKLCELGLLSCDLSVFIEDIALNGSEDTLTTASLEQVNDTEGSDNDKDQE